MICRPGLYCAAGGDGATASVNVPLSTESGTPDNKIKRVTSRDTE